MRLAYDTGRYPHAPILDILLGAPTGALAVGPLRALVDTGADGSIVPIRHLKPLDVAVDDHRYLRGLWGQRRQVDIYTLDIGIGELRLPSIEIVADDLGDEVIVGRDVLNRLILTLNGPRSILDLVG